MNIYLGMAQILVSIALIVVCLFQSRGAGLGGIFGQAESVYRTKRGVEKTLFQLTIVLAVLLIVICIFSVRLKS
jgi:preprotein translocase subunit SecG